MTYELNLEKFKGPLQKLLELIEEQKLEITEISLARVTDDFLKYLEKLEKVDASTLADFIVVASRLIFLKSKTLLPDLKLTEEEESEIKDLELRLKLYQDFKPAMKLVEKLWNERRISYSRPYFLNLGEGLGGDAHVFYPGEDISVASLHGSLDRIFENLKKLELETQTINEKIVTIEEKMREVIERLYTESKTTLLTFSKARSVSEVIIIFLAILHLAREQKIRLDQVGHLSDITITKGDSADDTVNSDQISAY